MSHESCSTKIMIASAGLHSHITPLLAAGNILMKHDQDVVVQTSPDLRPMVEILGVTGLIQMCKFSYLAQRLLL
jgi:UDP:flavonoid glycosyltransferase YjiC (YdhE family)